MLELKQLIFEVYGSLEILKAIDVEEFRDFIINMYKKINENKSYQLYCALYPLMVTGQMKYMTFEDIFKEKTTKIKEEKTEDSLKMVERIMNGIAR